MSYSIVQYPGDGATATWSVPFPYISKSDVSVKVDGVAATFTWPTTSTVTITPTPANGAVIEVKRSTSPGSRVVDFGNGANLDEASLDNSALQMFYMAQENLDSLLNAVTLDSDGKLNALSKIIKNLAAGVEATEAVNKGQLDAAALAPVTPAASSIANTPAGGIAATTVQAALNELDTEKLTKASNLSDVVDAPTARTNLGLGTAAVKNTGTSGNTVPLLDGDNTFSGTLAMSGKQIRAAKGANIAAAATVDLSLATGNFVTVTLAAGTVSISSLGSVPAGTEFLLKFEVTAGATLNVTYNAATNILPGGFDISAIPDTTACPLGAWAKVISLGGGNWKWLWFQYDQKWQAPSRSAGTVYQNLTGQAIDVSAWTSETDTTDDSLSITLSIDTNAAPSFAAAFNSDKRTGVEEAWVYGRVPPGSYYKVTITGGGASLANWRELR